MARLVVHEYTEAERAALVECEPFSAMVEGVPAMGGGKTRAEAVESLVTLLGDFVLGRDKTIAEVLDLTGYKFALPGSPVVAVPKE